MVKLGIISDSHNARIYVERYLELANREGYDAVFHTGDGESDARWLRRRLNMPLIAVAGNCDFGSALKREAVAEFEGWRILALHGDRYDVDWGLDQLSYYAESKQARIALYGHTHRALACYAGPILTINPGALAQARYAELTIDGDRATPVLKNLNEA